jgi:tetratricopeptide (TPR) repeat protein/TolB-like protein
LSAAAPTVTLNLVPRRSFSHLQRPALGLALGLAALAAGLLWWRREPRPDRRKVAVAVFTNRTGDSSLEPLGSMAADWVTRGLAQSALVDVVDVGTIYVQGRSDSGAPTDPRRLALRNGAGTVISGSYYLATDTIVLRASVEDAVAGTVLQTVEPVHAPASEAVQALDQLREQVVVAVAGVFDTRYSPFTSRPSTPRLQAYQSFVAGQTAYWRGGAPSEVRAHFSRALIEDGNFLASAVWLAFIGANGAGCGLTDSVATALEPRQAELSPFDLLTLRIASARCRNAWAEAYRLATRQAALKPRSAYAIYTAGFFAISSGRARAARELFRSLDPERDLGWVSDPAKAIFWRDYSNAEHVLGEYGAELRQAERQLRDFPPRLGTQLYAIRALAALGRGSEALARVDAAMRLPQDPTARVTGGMSAGHLAYQSAIELRVHGDSLRAREVAERAVAWFEADPARLTAGYYERHYLARSLLLLGRIDEAVATMAFVPGADTTDPVMITLRGVLAARQGRMEQARAADRQLAEMMTAPAVRSLAVMQRVRLKLALAERDSALALFREAVEREEIVRAPLGNDIHCDPLFDGLRNDPEFERVNRGL